MITGKKNGRRVLVVGPSTSGSQGGQVTHINNIKHAFASESEFCLGYFSSSSALEDKESKVSKVLLLMYRLLTFPFSLARFDLVHINTSFDDKAVIRDLFLILWVFIFRKKLVVQVHGGVLCKTVIARSTVFCLVWRRVFSTAGRILVLTDDQLESLSGLGFKDVEKLNNFVELPSLPVRDKNNKLVFIFLGRMVRGKGIFEILDAVTLLSKERRDFCVYFYGDGPERKLLQNKISDLSISEFAEWKGSVDGDEKARAFVGANAFLLPSYSEGLPYSVLEAMSSALPVICTRVGALPSLIEQNKEGMFVECQDAQSLRAAMLALMNDRELCSVMGRNCRDKIESQYSLPIMKDIFSKIWLTCLH